MVNQWRHRWHRRNDEFNEGDEMTKDLAHKGNQSPKSSITVFSQDSSSNNRLGRHLFGTILVSTKAGRIAHTGKQEIEISPKQVGTWRFRKSTDTDNWNILKSRPLFPFAQIPNLMLLLTDYAYDKKNQDKQSQSRIEDEGTPKSNWTRLS